MHSATTGRRRCSCGWFHILFSIGIVVGAFTVALPAMSASAQTEPLAANGVTVTGYGEATSPAETAVFQLLITRNDSFGGPPPQPRPGDVPGETEREQVAPIVEALTGAGVEQAAIEVVVSPVFGQAYGPSGSVVARLDLTLDAPDLDQVNTLLIAASVAAVDEDLLIGQVGVDYQVADCESLERQARESAITDARARAAVQADLLGVELGGVTASTDMPANAFPILSYYGVALQPGGCAPPLPGGTLDAGSIGVAFPSFDPTEPPMVEVYAQVTLTFAIQSTE